MKEFLKYSYKEINGEEVGFFFGLLSLNLFFKEREENPKNIEIALKEALEKIAPFDEESKTQSLDIVNGFDLLVDLIYSMAKAYSIVKGQSFLYSKIQVMGWIDQIGVEGLMDLLPQDNEKPSEEVKQLVEEEAKKKSH